MYTVMLPPLPGVQTTPYNQMQNSTKKPSTPKWHCVPAKPGLIRDYVLQYHAASQSQETEITQPKKAILWTSSPWSSQF